MDANRVDPGEQDGTVPVRGPQVDGPSVTSQAEGLADVRAITLEQLAAVHTLLGTDRRAREYDILFSTALESLRDAPQTEAALVADAQRVWPGAGIDAARMNQALQAAAAAGYIGHVGMRTGPWTLTPRGREEVAATRDWASDTLRRTADDVRARLEAASRPTTIEQAQLWVGILVRAILAGVRGSVAAYIGDVEIRGERALAPRAFNRDDMIAVIGAAVAKPEDAELLSALALEAFDPLSTFGNDLVMHITVGYMLHAFVARRDNLGARRAAGSLRDHRAILDTPVLLPLLGTEEQSGPILRAISAALSTDMEVIVPEHYLTEVIEVVDRVEREYVRELEAELRGGVSADLLGRMVDEEVISLWLRAMDGGVYADWAGFRAAALGLRERLTLLGVIVRDHRNTDADNVDDIERRLTAEIASRGSGRGRAQIRRDAESIAMARRRRARPDPAHGFWPGAWIITPDSQMRRVHRAMSPMDPFGLTLTPSQWIGVVSTCSDPATIEDLATSAATLLSEETFLAIAGRYPVRVAMEVARALRPDGVASPIDDRLAQLSVDDLLMRQPDFDLEGDEAGAAVAAAVVARRSARQSEAYVAGTRRLEADRTAAALEVETAKSAAERERQDRAAERRDHEAERGDWADERRKLAEGAVLSGRRVYRNVGVVVLAVVLILALLLQVWPFALTTAITLTVFLFLGEDWVRDVDVTATRFLLGVIIEGAGLAAAFLLR
jgi:hypothetical protein